MPRYDYVCDECGLFWESTNTVEECNNEKCECGKPARKLFSAPLIKYNCSGFHSTDYTSDGPKYRDAKTKKVLDDIRKIGGKEYRRRKRIERGANPNR